MNRSNLASSTTVIECDHCGNDTFTAHRRDSGDRPATIYIECEACGASVITATQEP